VNESEIIRLVRQIIKQELAPILMGVVTSNESQTQSTFQHFSSEAPIGPVRSIQPFGLSSRAPVGTSLLTIPVNADATHQNIVGHFDTAKPTGADGETLLYDAFGHVIYMSESQVSLGAKAATQNVVLGQILKTLFDNWLGYDQAQTHTGNLGFPTSPPLNAAQYAAIQASPVDDETMLSEVVFTV
jgi:hypothetical protein